MKNKANADKLRDVDDELHVYNHRCLDEWSTFKVALQRPKKSLRGVTQWP